MITEEEKKEFIRIGERMLEIYHKLPQNGSKRKIMAAEDLRRNGNFIMFFQGTQTDAERIRKMLNESQD